MSSVSKKRTSAKNKPADRRILSKARREERGEKPVSEGIHRAAERAGIEPPASSGADYATWQAQREARKAAEATGAPELVALRKLARLAEHIFEAQGIIGDTVTPLEILGEAIRWAQSDFAVIGYADSSGSGTADSMVFRRAEMRLDLALALAEYRAEFSGEAVAS